MTSVLSDINNYVCSCSTAEPAFNALHIHPIFLHPLIRRNLTLKVPWLNHSLDDKDLKIPDKKSGKIASVPTTKRYKASTMSYFAQSLGVSALQRL